MTKRAPTTKLELVAWVNLAIATGEKSTSQKFCISNRAVCRIKGHARPDIASSR